MITKSDIKSFEECSFHDCYIHGVSFDAIEETYLGQESLLIDIDYIVGWPNCANQASADNYFHVSRAILKFNDVANLRVGLLGQDYISRIERIAAIDDSEIVKHEWLIYRHTGEIIVELNAINMSVELIGTIFTLKNRQFLTTEERKIIYQRTA